MSKTIRLLGDYTETEAHKMAQLLAKEFDGVITKGDFGVLTIRPRQAQDRRSRPKQGNGNVVSMRRFERVAAKARPQPPEGGAA